MHMLSLYAPHAKKTALAARCNI